MTESAFVAGIVDSCGNAAQDIAGQVSPVANKFDRTADTVARHGGMASAQALEACRDGWSRRIGQQAQEVTATADNLHQSVRDYTSTDEAAGQRIGSAGRNRAI